MSVPIQEYSPDFPHVKYTLGLAGRPGGPDFYISTLDNTHNHGPGSQNEDAKVLGEADPCFGRVIAGIETVRAMGALHTKPGGFGLLEQPVSIVGVRVVAHSPQTGPSGLP